MSDHRTHCACVACKDRRALLTTTGPSTDQPPRGMHTNAAGTHGISCRCPCDCMHSGTCGWCLESKRADQPPPKPTGAERIVDLVKAALDDRAAKGIETYGKPLLTTDTRDALTDEVEELLDAVQYRLLAHVQHRRTLAVLRRLQARVCSDVCTDEHHPDCIEARAILGGAKT